MELKVFVNPEGDPEREKGHERDSDKETGQERETEQGRETGQERERQSKGEADRKNSVGFKAKHSEFPSFLPPNPKRFKIIEQLKAYRNYIRLYGHFIRK